MNDTSDEPQQQPGLPAPYVSPRRDGWTVTRQDAFLKALAACGCVTHACRAVGMSRESAYELYQRPAAAAFRAGWDAALDCSIRLVEDGAWSRAIQGVPRPIFCQGEQVGEYRHRDERLTMFLLRFRRPRPLSRPAPAAGHPPARLGGGRPRSRRRDRRSRLAARRSRRRGRAARRRERNLARD